MLRVSGCLIDRLPERLPGGLLVLECDNNNLEALPLPLPKGLTHLDCADNYIAGLGELPGSLKRLDCSKNSIRFIKGIPDTCTYLEAGGNPLLYTVMSRYSLFQSGDIGMSASLDRCLFSEDMYDVAIGS